jgi:uncharacterized membrane protein
MVIACVFFTVVGGMMRNFLGKLLMRISEGIVTRVPILSPVYKNLKQIFEIFIKGYDKAFKEVVMLEFPLPGHWTVGFITGTIKETQIDPSEELLSVLVPTALNPTGFLLFVPRKKLRKVDISVEHALKLILSGGIMPPAEAASGKKA